jgi:hypothetical protein
LRYLSLSPDELVEILKGAIRVGNSEAQEFMHEPILAPVQILHEGPRPGAAD